MANTDPDILKVNAEERKKPEFKLGQEVLENYDPSEKPNDNHEPEPQIPKNLKEEFDESLHPLLLNKTLKETYPEVADDNEEKLLADVRKHWLGRTSIIVTGGFVVVLLLTMAVAIPGLVKGNTLGLPSQMRGLITTIFILAAILVGVGTYISYWVYNHSRMLITDQNVIELRQMSLFSHKISHLNMINVEDVTVIKRGILQTVLNYGLIQIETAGEKDNFAFPNTPNPDAYRRMVINCHERAIERIGQMGPMQRVSITHNSL